MTDQSKRADKSEADAGKSTGNAEGGADSSGPGNILAGVQPKAGDESDESERRDE